MTASHETKDFWSYLEKMQDATDFVQEALVKNARLERRLAELEEENHTLRAQRATLRRLLRRSQEEDRLLQYQLVELQPPARLAAVSEAA